MWDCVGGNGRISGEEKNDFFVDAGINHACDGHDLRHRKIMV